MQAVIDRFEGEDAVLLIGENEEQQLNVAKKFLPKEVKEGDCLKIDFQINTETTEKRKEKAKELLDKISSK